MSSSWAADRSGSDICNSASDAINSEELCLETKVAKWTKWQRFSEQVEGVPDSRKTRHFYCCRKENHKNWRKESSRDSGRWQMSYNAIFQVAGSSLAYTEGPWRLLLGNWNLLDSRQVIRYLQLLQHFPTKKKGENVFVGAPLVNWLQGLALRSARVISSGNNQNQFWIFWQKFNGNLSAQVTNGKRSWPFG